MGVEMSSGPWDWLNDRAYNVYSQFGEDGVLEEIFKCIKPANKWALECGAADGLLFSNTRLLLERGWNAVLVEADCGAFQRLVQNCIPFGAQVKCVNAKVTRDVTLDDILAQCEAPLDIDLAVIDVDGQEFYLINQMLRYRPRVILVEYDPHADPEFIPTCGGAGQTGLQGITKLVMGKYYVPVWHNECNLIFVKHPLHVALNRNVHQALAEESRNAAK